MSYILHLWRQPIPKSLAHAEALLPDLRHQLLFSTEPEALRLLDALAQGTPDGDLERYWNDFPCADELNSPVVSLSPVTVNLELVLPIILKVAREQGWVVFDGQSGEVSCPDGRVLRRATAKGTLVHSLASAPASDDASPAARARWLREVLAPVFASHGYAVGKGHAWFSKVSAVGRFIFFGRPIRSHLEHSFSLVPAYPRSLAGALDSDGGPALSLGLHTFAELHGLPFRYDLPQDVLAEGLGGYELPISAAALPNTASELGRLYGEAVLDFADSLQSLQDLDHWANRVPDKDCPFPGLRHRADRYLLNFHPDLLLAHATNAPDFEARARERLAQYEADWSGRQLVPALKQLMAACGLVI